MSRPVVVMLALGPNHDRAAAISDPAYFLDRYKDLLDTHEHRYLAQAHLLGLAAGAPWGLVLPGELNVETIRELYGEQVAEALAEAVARDPTAPLCWKVVECASRGTDGAALDLRLVRSYL